MTLAQVWFVLIAVLWVGFLVLEGFDFGVGMLHGVLGGDEAGRRTVLGTIEPVWDGNEVWLIVAGAGMFAAFPGWYATMFSAMYLALVLLLVALILRGTALVLRGKRESRRWRRNWSVALTASSLVAPLLAGVALADLLKGIPIGQGQEYVGSFWDLLQPYALYTGVTLVVLCLLHGAAFVALRTVGPVHDRADRAARRLAPVTAALVVGFAIWTLTIVSRAGTWVLAVAAVAAVLAAALLAGTGRDGAAFGATAVTIGAVVGSLFVGLHPRVMISSRGPAFDLTLDNTASASYSLTVMTVVAAVLLPVVLIYQGWTYHVFRQRLGRAAVPVGTPGPAPAVTPAPRSASEVGHRPDGSLVGDGDGVRRPPTRPSG